MMNNYINTLLKQKNRIPLFIFINIIAIFSAIVSKLFSLPFIYCVILIGIFILTSPFWVRNVLAINKINFIDQKKNDNDKIKKFVVKKKLKIGHKCCVREYWKTLEVLDSPDDDMQDYSPDDDIRNLGKIDDIPKRLIRRVSEELWLIYPGSSYQSLLTKEETDKRGRRNG